MKKQKTEIPFIFYLYLHSKVCDMTKGDLITRKYLKYWISRWNIPHKLRELIIKELEILGLISIKERNILKLNPSQFNIDDCNKYYEELGLY